LRAGQLAADTEFINAKYTDVFTNASLGWPAITSINLPSGGPSPPLAAPGARLRANVADNLTEAAAIFDGDAAGSGPGDPRLRDNNGINFRNDPPLVIGEVQYIWNGKKGDPGLDGKFKIGGWRHFGEFSDQHRARHLAGKPCEFECACGTVRNFGIYSVFEQKVYRVGNDDDRRIGIFARLPSSPSDRNLIDVYADGGVEFIGSSDQRPKEQAGSSRRLCPCLVAGAASTSISSSLLGLGWPPRSFESLVTAVYQYEVRSGWTPQPNFQYFTHPGGGATNPLGSNPGRLLRDAAVFGLRTVLKF
jgi:porin